MNRIQLWFGVLGAAHLLTMPAVAIADQSDDLLQALVGSIQLTNAAKADALSRLRDLNQQARRLSEQIAAVAAQSEALEKLEPGKPEQQIKEMEEKIDKLKEQQEKLTLIRDKMDALLPKIMDAIGQSQNAQDSVQVLAAVSHDRAKAARLIEAIQQNKTSDIGNLLGQGAKGAKIDIREVNNADGAAAVFRVGGLIHCVSTTAQCGGKSSSLTKGKGGDQRASDAVEPIRKTLQVADKQATERDKAIADFIAAVSSTSDETLSQQYAAELQRLLTKALQALSASATSAAKTSAAIEAIIGNIRG